MQVSFTFANALLCRHWLYGEVMSNHPHHSKSTNEKGWFPVCCVVPINDTIPDTKPNKRVAPEEAKKQK